MNEAAKPSRASRPRGSGSIFRKEGCSKWIIQYYKVDPATGKKRRVRESTGEKDRSEALKILTERLSQINKQEPFEHRHVRGAVTVADLYKALKTDTEISKGEKSRAVKGLEWRWAHLKPVFAHVRAANFTTDDAKKYQRDRKKEGAAPATINRELGMVRRFFNLGKRSTPPKVSVVPYIPMLKENNVRTGFVEDAGYSQLVAGANELFLRLFIELAFTYGWRAGELVGSRGLRVRQTNFLNRTIRLDPGTTKNGEGREVYMTPRVEELLRAAVEGKEPEDYVLTWEEDGRPVKDFRATWRNLCIGAGLGEWVCSNAECKEPCTAKAKKCAKCGSKRKYKGLIRHDFRRSAAKALRRSGVSESVIMNCGGWLTRSVFDRYAIVSSADQQQAVELLELARERTRERERAEAERPTSSAHILEDDTIGALGARSRNPRCNETHCI